MKKKFSYEINGLRGLAVILVFLFHINQELFYLGYIGVDIFFVISGFVITKLIHDQQKKNDFSLMVFYINRFLRLYPALLIFIFFGIILIFFLNIAGDYRTFINTGIYSLFGQSNLFLYTIENDYFNALDINPFIHTWSLSIEFQFYLIFPFFLILFIEKFKNENKIIISLIVLIVFFLILSNFFNLNSFYQTSARIWEPMIGSLAFFIKKNNKIILKSLFEIILLFIIFSFFLILNLSVSLNILIATILTFLFILQMESGFILNKILRTKIFQFIGNISYSIYLWHFLVIYFVDTYFIKLDYYLLSIIFSIIISCCSFYLIENPIRRSVKTKKFLFSYLKPKVIISTGLSFFLILISIHFFNYKNNILNFYNEEISKIYNRTNIEKKFQHNGLGNKKVIKENCHEIYSIFDNELLEENKCYLINNKKHLIYLFGDSHSWHFQPLFKNIDLETDLLMTSYNNSSFSKPFFNGIDSNFETAGDIATKKLFNNVLLLSKKYSKLYLILSFNHHKSQSAQRSKDFYKVQEKNYSKLYKKLPENVKIIFIEDTPIIRHTENTCNVVINLSTSLLKSNKDKDFCDYKKKDVEKKMVKIKKMFESLKYNNEIYSLNILDYFCPNNNCNFYHPKKRFALIYDGSHINYETSIDLIMHIEQKLIDIFKR